MQNVAAPISARIMVAFSAFPSVTVLCATAVVVAATKTNLRRSVGGSAPEGERDDYHHYHLHRLHNFGRNLDLSCHRRDVEGLLKQDRAHSQFFMTLYLRSCNSRLIFSGGR
jgi:hypothetical protein